MVAPAQHYYVRSKAGERGPFTLSQVSTMWSTGHITVDSFYRLSNAEEWAPISQLQETLEALAPSTFQPPKRIAHDRIVEGDGSRESPFVIHTSNYGLSAQIQGEIIDLTLGPGTYNSGGSRHYSESTRGKPGNGDICEHVFLINGRNISVWFDLYLVTGLVEDPELKKIKKGMIESPQGQLLQGDIRRMIGVTEPEPEKKAPGPGSLIPIVKEPSAEPFSFDPEEAEETLRQYRITWRFLYIIIWFLIGYFFIGGYALVGLICSIPILRAQVRWREEQILKQAGMSDSEIRARSYARAAGVVMTLIAVALILILIHAISS
jgi:hypothetical protein